MPAEWRERFGLRRYGFHGLSHAYAARRATEVVAAAGPPARRVIVPPRGRRSLAAVHEGLSVDTTMGFTPLEGLTMATRSGTVDPGAVLWLVTHHGLDPAEVADALEHRSGLLGLAGTADMAEVVERAERGDAGAGLALAKYLHRLRAGICAMAASLGGLDVLVFTGGVGENAAGGAGRRRPAAVPRPGHRRRRQRAADLDAGDQPACATSAHRAPPRGARRRRPRGASRSPGEAPC